jgi:AraC-like DNA-binding protein
MTGGHDRASGSPAVAAADGLAADTLSDVLEAVRLTGALFFLVDATTPWIAQAPASASLAPAILPRAQLVVSFHVITRGTCWGLMAGSPPMRLEPGDVLVVPHGDEYALASEPGLRTAWSTSETLEWFRQMSRGQLPFVVEEGGGGRDRVGVVCGFLGCDAHPYNPLLSTLPRLLRVAAPPATDGDRLAPLVDFAVRESRDRHAGSRTVRLRVAELIFVEALRRHLQTMTDGCGGWLEGLRDPLVGRALASLHAQPARAWTMDELAREAGASRSVLAERFTQLVGQPAMRYLASWRMQLASRRLAGPGAKVSAVASEVGYDSEAAFSRAFKKLTGMPPAAWRRARALDGV